MERGRGRDQLFRGRGQGQVFWYRGRGLNEDLTSLYNTDESEISLVRVLKWHFPDEVYSVNKPVAVPGSLICSMPVCLSVCVCLFVHECVWRITEITCTSIVVLLYIAVLPSVVDRLEEVMQTGTKVQKPPPKSAQKPATTSRPEPTPGPSHSASTPSEPRRLRTVLSYNFWALEQSYVPILDFYMKWSPM